MSDALDLDIRLHRQLLNSNASPTLYPKEPLEDHSFTFPYSTFQSVKSRETCRFRILEELLINAVHGGKVIHRREEDLDFDNILQARACFFEHGREVLEALGLQMMLILL